VRRAIKDKRGRVLCVVVAHMRDDDDDDDDGDDGDDDDDDNDDHR